MKKFLWIIIGGAILFVVYLWYSSKKAVAAAKSATPLNQLLNFWAPQGTAQAAASGFNINTAAQAANNIKLSTSGLFSGIGSLFSSGAKGANSPTTAGSGTSSPQIEAQPIDQPQENADDSSNTDVQMAAFDDTANF